MNDFKSLNETVERIISVKNVSKFYGGEVKHFEALHSVSFDINRGELVAVTGPPGCGKTTLFNILGLLESPTSGNIVVNGTDINDLNKIELNSLQVALFGYISPALGLVDYFDVSNNVKLGVRYKRLNKKYKESCVLSILQRLDLTHLQNEYPSSLTAFESEKVLLARAMVAAPEILLVDDFGHNLDSRHAKELFNTLRQFVSNGTTLVFTTSNVAMSEFADKTFGLLDGAIVTEQQWPGKIW